MQTSQATELSNGEPPFGIGLRSPSERVPLARLLQLLLILQSERFPNARRLAESCEVSRRTIYRDLATLEAAGIDVVYQPERQGYQLAKNCWLQPSQLEEKEALALLILSRTRCSALPFGLSHHARNALGKVIQSLPGELRRRIADCGELLALEPLSVPVSPDRAQIHETICKALSQRRLLQLFYRERVGEPTAATRFGLYRLAHYQKRWCLIGHSTADRRVRSFELAWIERLELTDEPYAIPPRFNLEKFLGKFENDSPSSGYEVRLRLSPSAAAFGREIARGLGHRHREGPDESLEVFLKAQHIADVVPWLADYGDQVEVIEPEELRTAIKDWANQLARVHGRSN